MRPNSITICPFFLWGPSSLFTRPDTLMSVSDVSHLSPPPEWIKAPRQSCAVELSVTMDMLCLCCPALASCHSPAFSSRPPLLPVFHFISFWLKFKWPPVATGYCVGQLSSRRARDDSALLVHRSQGQESTGDQTKIHSSAQCAAKTVPETGSLQQGKGFF